MKVLDRWIETCLNAVLADFHAYHVRSGEGSEYTVCGLDGKGEPVALIECCHEADAALVAALLDTLQAVHRAAH